ncbi:MAG: hypothetical protein H6822_24970 [Planctomycetaceae bacterium]|nr:hypothetical protein [Planctomycetales bacterium]MCB9925430.1 hypothetical protein [Planctomycetaceae bacterium]
MQYINSQMVADAINQLDDRFDAHGVEKRTLRLHTNAFAQELTRYATSPDPLRQFSAAFAKFVDALFRGEIRQTQKVTSENLGGEQSPNQQWEKVMNPVTGVGQPIGAVTQDAM